MRQASILPLWPNLSRFEMRPVKVGPGWLVIIKFPDRPEMQVSDFATEADAKNWVTNDSWAWLRKLGYGDD